MRFRFLSRGLLLVLSMAIHSLVFATYAAVTDLPKIELNKGGIIKAIVELSDGSLIIGGQFTRINGIEQTGLARLKPDGSFDEEWNAHVVGGNVPGINALVLSGDTLYLGGNFYEVGGEFRKSLARIDVVTGKVDHSWNPYQDGDTSNMRIYALQISADSQQLFVGGYFSRLGGIDISAVAKVSTLSGDVDPDWNPHVKQHENIYTLLLSGDDLYIGGQLTEVGGTARQAVAKLSATGTGALDTQWDPKVEGNWVHALAVSADGTQLYLGGDFYTINGSKRWGLARVSATGTGELDTAWDANINFGSSSDVKVWSLFLSSDGLYVGGAFSNIGGQDRNSIARLSTTDATADAWNPDTGLSTSHRYSNVESILPSADGSKIHLGGSFHSMGNTEALAFASVEKTTGDPVSGTVDLLIGNPGEIHAITISGDSLYFGGDFVRANGKPLYYLGKWDMANQKLLDWSPRFNHRVLSLAADDNAVFAGGNFTRIDGQERNRLAKLAASDGAVDATWNPDASGSVETMLLKDNSLYIGGWFSNVGGTTRQHLARLAADTGVVDAWNPDANNRVLALALSGTDLFVGGEFTNIGGQAKSRLAKVDTGTGLADAGWTADADNAVKTLALTANTLFAGGSFKMIHGETRHGVAKLDTADGSVAADWNLDLNRTTAAYIVALELSKDETNLYVGGRNYRIGDATEYRSLAKFTTADGTRDSQWDPAPAGYVLALATADSGIFAGGKFFQIGGKHTALGHIVDGHMLTVNLTATNTDAYEGMVTSEPAGITCQPTSTISFECKRAFVPGDITLKTVSNDPAITLSQQWLSGCTTGGGADTSCGLTLDADKTVEMELSCENHDVPAPDQPITAYRNIWCNNIQVTQGFEVNDGGRVTLTANHGVTLGPGFRVNFQTVTSNQFFKVRMQ